MKDKNVEDEAIEDGSKFSPIQTDLLAFPRPSRVTRRDDWGCHAAALLLLLESISPFLNWYQIYVYGPANCALITFWLDNNAFEGMDIFEKFLSLNKNRIGPHTSPMYF